MTTELHRYPARVLSELKAKVPWEKEFLEAVEEVFQSISPLLAQQPRYEAERILERMVVPERVIAFPVVWTDDQNQINVNQGWRVQFNSALGPYKGGTRFHASVSLSILKSLAFEQTFKNALTGLPLGGGKGGADLAFRSLSDHEMRRFCQGYMTEVWQNLGAERDVPAGDIGVGTREIGYLFGHYKRLTREFHGVFTGKGLDWGGSRLRPEATGYGVVYFLEEMLKASGRGGVEGAEVAVSGFGNVAWGAVKKIAELGGKVVTLSGPDGFVHDPDGVSGDKVEFMRTMRWSGRDQVKQYAEEFGVEFHAGQRPWSVPCKVALPCAIENELDKEDAEHLVKNGCWAVVEGANMPCTAAARRVLSEGKVMFSPGKASNAGGVAVSGLEMVQNRVGRQWKADRVDATLRDIMANIHTICMEAAERCGRPGDYLLGANVAGFTKVADAMIDQGAI